MSDLLLRLTVLMMDGFICNTCGVEIDGHDTGHPRDCCRCRKVQNETSSAVKNSNYVPS